MEPVLTLQQHIMRQQRAHPGATGAFSAIMTAITVAAKVVSREVNKAGLVEILGLTGEENVHGEEIMKLDEFAQATYVKNLEHSGHLCIMASEESPDVIRIPEELQHGRYVLVFDPLDGSSNIDANVSIGTIFGIYRRLAGEGPGMMEDCLQPARELVCAGYVIYGSSTMLVYTSGSGVHGFTLDPSVGEFLLSHPDIKIPARGKILSVNEGNYHFWEEGVRKYVDYLRAVGPKEGRPYTSRYIGSLVADFHRNLLYGGVFLYPADTRHGGELRGKLRLLYEAGPLGFVAEQAGGMASDGSRRILDIVPTTLHQRTALIIGGREDVEMADRIIGGGG